MAFLAGLKVIEIDSSKATVTVPYKCLNKNPFRSIYFAVLSMAAELATGILAMAAIKDYSVPVSMLVLEMKAGFQKKQGQKLLSNAKKERNLVQPLLKVLKQEKDKQ